VRIVITCKCWHIRQWHIHYSSVQKIFHPSGVVTGYCSHASCDCKKWRLRIRIERKIAA
jgi:hypothetical protein